MPIKLTKNSMMKCASTAAFIVMGLGISQAYDGSAHAVPFTTGSTGDGNQVANHQPGIGINYLIALQGVFPSRNADTGEITQSGGSPHLGEISMFAGNFAPRGFAIAQGQILSINSNQALFSLLGTTYGGDGESTFALPDLRGRSAMHHGNGAGLSNYNLGQKSGVDYVAAQMPVHAHTVAGFDPTTNAGTSVSQNNLKPALAINYNIVTAGTFPSRNAGTGDIGTNSAFPTLAFVQMFAGNFAPRGTVPTNGQLLQIASNTALFSLVGTTYGGDGSTTFGVPALQSRLVMGGSEGLINRQLGTQTGQETVTLATTNMANHTHAQSTDTEAPDAAIGSIGDGQSYTDMQPSNTLNYIVATQGLFPSRNAGTGEITNNDQEPFLGEIALFAGTFAPRGWEFADGQIMSIAQNSALFSILGTTYGGDGESTFALPDLQGRVAVGVGTGPGLRTWQLGEKHGAETDTQTSSTLPAHDHNYVPEPTSAALLLFGGLGLMARRRRPAA